MTQRYTEEDYESDLSNPGVPHLENREHFSAFYEALGNGPAKDVKYPKHRMGWITPPKGASILELGCAAGYNLVHWLEEDRSCSVTGVDLSLSAIAEASRRIGAMDKSVNAPARACLFQSFIEDAPQIIIGRFSDVVLTEVLEHVQDPQPVIDVAWGFVADGGRLWITVPSNRWGNYSHVRGVGKGELKKMLEKAGVTGDMIELLEQEKVQGQPLTKAKIVKR